MISFTSTERGFTIGEFTDRYGQKCSLQASSLATEAAIWYGVDIDLKGEEVSNRMHLTIPMVQEHLPALLNFVYTGELSGQDANHPIAIVANLTGKVIRSEKRRVKIQEQISKELTPTGAKFLTQTLSLYNLTH